MKAEIDHVLFIQSSADGHVGCFHLLAAQPIHVPVLCGPRHSILLGTHLRVGLLGHMVNFFNFLRNCQTVNFSGCTASNFTTISEGSILSACLEQFDQYAHESPTRGDCSFCSHPLLATLPRSQQDTALKIQEPHLPCHFSEGKKFVATRKKHPKNVKSTYNQLRS